MFDLDRVEVLRGPQGTLFGRNTPAGIVKFDSVKPGEDLNGYARVSYGRFNAVSAQGAVGGLLAGDTLSARLSVLYQRQDDWVDNANPSAPEDDAFEGYDEFAARLQFLLKPTDEPQHPARRPDAFARRYRASVSRQRVRAWREGPDVWLRARRGLDRRSERPAVDTYNLSANITYDFGPVSLISVTSYWDGEATSVGDVDGGFGASFLPPALTGPGVIPFTAETRDSVPKPPSVHAGNPARQQRQRRA